MARRLPRCSAKHLKGNREPSCAAPVQRWNEVCRNRTVSSRFTLGTHEAKVAPATIDDCGSGYDSRWCPIASVWHDDRHSSFVSRCRASQHLEHYTALTAHLRFCGLLQTIRQKLEEFERAGRASFKEFGLQTECR